MASPSLNKKKSKQPVYRSGLEQLVGSLLKHAGLDHKHEPITLKYVIPTSTHRYTPDFVVNGNEFSPTLYLEVKGRYTSQDRKKTLLVKQAHPTIILLLIFGRSANTLSRKSKTTYANWCDKNNIPWCDIKEFTKDPRKCLSNLIRNRAGTLKTLPKKNIKPLLQPVKS